MSQTMQFSEAGYVRCLPRSLAAVPQLDWPSDLFADDVVAEISDDDFPLPFDIAAVMAGSGCQLQMH